VRHALLVGRVAWITGELGGPGGGTEAGELGIVANGQHQVAVGNDAQFARFCAAAGAARLAGDPRYATNQGRVAHRAELVPRIAALLGQRTTQEWLAALDIAQVPCGPINDLAQVFDEPKVRHRDLRLDLPHPLAGSVPGVRNPVRFSRTAIQYARSPPPLGADTGIELRNRLGLDDEALEALAARGVIA
jgi:crotonobetainyl-CoA:carnitine CoA-transferase CaiB-like acyl-CoA transferase